MSSQLSKGSLRKSPEFIFRKNNIIMLKYFVAFRNADGKVTQEEFVQTCLGKFLPPGI